MNLQALFQLLGEARALCGHDEYVVIGSVSILGLAEVSAIPDDMTMSIDADCYTLKDPDRLLDLQQALGEGSAFHRRHGIYLDPVNPRLPTLPEGWAERMIRVERDGVVAWFLEPHDAAVSKLARAEPRDLRWVAAGVKAGLLTMPTVLMRMRRTSFLDEAEQRAAESAARRLSLR